MASVIDDLEGLAATAYRAYCHAAGGPCLPWEHLGLEPQASWLRLAMRADAILEDMGGQPWSAIGQKCFEAAALPDPPSPNAGLWWQAVARHLASLLLADEGDNVDREPLEQSWREWVQKQLARQLAS